MEQNNVYTYELYNNNIITYYNFVINNHIPEQLYDDDNLINYSHINLISNYLYKLYLYRKINGLIYKNKPTIFFRSSSPLRYSTIRYSTV